VKLLVIAPDSFQDLALLRRQESADLTLVVSENIEVLRRSAVDADAVALAPRHGQMMRELWPHASRLRWVHTLGAGVERLLFDELAHSDVVVTNSRGLFADALAEFVIASMLWFAKDLRRVVENQRQHRWEPYTVQRLEGRTAGIIGYGGIGRAVARRAHALGMRVIATRRRTELASGDAIVTRMYEAREIDTLIAESSYLVLSTPLTASTYRLMNAARLSLMRSDAVLINVGRGDVVDERALVTSLRERSIRGAALDVFEREPLPPDHLLWSLDNVLISPHTADHTSDSHARSMAFFLEQLGHFRRGEPLENVVDKHERY
jgi:phosphoglycerate dehydrogenase-like enzyme